ncbi:MAG: hypothetical protein K2Q11_07175 [Burkholderiaceae bacterium]|nr:hypothetical protein [Burkholderiaceae bacterium]
MDNFAGKGFCPAPVLALGRFQRVWMGLFSSALRMPFGLAFCYLFYSYNVLLDNGYSHFCLKSSV